MGERTTVLAWLLAHHWQEAGDPARAVDYLLAAAKQSVERWAKQEMLDLYTKAIELLGELDQQRGLEIRLLRALALVDLSDFKAGAAELDELLPSLEGRQEMEALFARARAAFWHTDG